MQSNQYFNQIGLRLRACPASVAPRASGRLLAVMALLLVALVAGPVSAQAPQPGTETPIPGVPPGNSPRAEGPAQATPDPDMGEEDEDDGEGCPYLGQPLELVV